MKIICSNCLEKQNLKNTYCPVCGNNLSEQYFEEEIQKSRQKIDYEKEKIELLQHCLQECENNIGVSVIANRYVYFQNRDNKVDCHKL